MKSAAYQPIVHHFAVATTCVALLPIIVGAIVTTTRAGMAFPDWPTSDGHNMFLYNWLESTGAKFVEHGHRLAGSLIGLISIAFATVVWKDEPRRWVRIAATGVLLGVIAQGVLGGMRVRMDARVMAMVHGSFAAIVFALMSGVALVTSRSWHEVARTRSVTIGRHLKPLSILTTVLIATQYVLGGTLRHLGMSLYEHIGLAAIVLIVVVVMSVSALISQSPWLRNSACMFLGLVILQVLLGASAYVVKLGFPPTGYVAVQNSLPQVLFCTAHTVTGMLLFATSVRMAMRVMWLESLQRIAGVSLDNPVAVDITAKGAVS